MDASTCQNPSATQKEKQEPENNHSEKCSCKDIANGIIQEAFQCNIIVWWFLPLAYYSFCRKIC